MATCFVSLPLVVREVVPRLATQGHVLANGAPLALAQVRPPEVPLVPTGLLPERLDPLAQPGEPRDEGDGGVGFGQLGRTVRHMGQAVRFIRRKPACGVCHGVRSVVRAAARACLAAVTWAGRWARSSVTGESSRVRTRTAAPSVTGGPASYSG